MKTAEKIASKVISETWTGSTMSMYVRMINEARKETIEECAERAKSEWVRWGEHMGHQVEKQSILSLINELK